MHKSQYASSSAITFWKPYPRVFIAPTKACLNDQQHFLQTAEPSFCYFAASAFPGFTRNSSLFPFRLGSKDKQCDFSRKTPWPALSQYSFEAPRHFWSVRGMIHYDCVDIHFNKVWKLYETFVAQKSKLVWIN